MIGGLLQGLEATANTAKSQADQAEDAIEAIRSLDWLVKGILVGVNFTVTVDAWLGMTASTCLDLAARYPGLRFIHNGKVLPEDEPNEQPTPAIAHTADLPNRSNARTPDYCQRCGWHRDDHDGRVRAPEGLGPGLCKFDPWPEKAEKS